MKCKSFIFFIIAVVFMCNFLNFRTVRANALNEDNSFPYYIYDEYNNLLSERYFVEEGDIIITNNLVEYKVYFVDYSSHIAFAKQTGYYTQPKIVEDENQKIRFAPAIKKSVGIYMTHNDESFTPTDGYSSVYGKGGIHDVAKSFKEEFEKLGYIVYFDETLHLPHDSKAYSRSVTTAKKLLENKPDALFDVHRDGVSRSVYVKNIDGVERCKIRIVVGQANPNKDANLQFAMYLVSVAKEYCPWLFLDIYYAKGHYNQELTSKGLLFEMGTYLAEKEIVLKSLPYLAEVIDKTLFSTVVEEDNTLTVKDEAIATNEENNVNNILQEFDNQKKVDAQQKSQPNLIVVIALTTLLLIAITFVKFKLTKSYKKLNKNL